MGVHAVICGPVSEMDSGRDGTTPGPASAMSVEETWGLTQAEETGYGP